MVGISQIPVGITGKNEKKIVVVFTQGKAHGLGLYQNMGHNLSSFLKGAR